MMRSVVHRLRTLTSADYVALVETCVLAVVVEIALRVVPLSTILARRCVDRPGAALTAHAWVALDEVCIGDDGSHFHELSRVRAWSA